MRVLPAALLGLLFFTAAARAQLMLQGAVGAVPLPKGDAAPLQRPASAVRLPRTDSLFGHDLSHGGSTGRMIFEHAGKDLMLSRLAMAGELISRPGESCQMDIAAGSAIVIKPAGEPLGLLRYDVQLPVCPFSFDVLDGAVLVSAANQTCDFVAADCRVSPTGLWGPSGVAFNAARAQVMAHALVAAETNMRANFRALLKKADQTAVKAIAGVQAGFSSEREVLCRDYSLEARHGFCALRITEAKLFALQARLGISVKEDIRKEKPVPKSAIKPSVRAPRPPEIHAREQAPAN